MKLINPKLIASILGTASLVFTLTAFPTATQASDTFSDSEISGPTGYFKSSKAQFAFHWKNLKTDSGVQTILIFGDFHKPQIQLGMPSLNNISKDRKTFTSEYKFISSKGKLLTQKYYFPIKKLSDNSYQIHLAYHDGARVPSANGKSYVFTKSATSPAKSYAHKYSAKVLKKEYTLQLQASSEKQYRKEKAKGKSVSDPATNKTMQKKIAKRANAAVAKSVKQIIKGFNYSDSSK